MLVSKIRSLASKAVVMGALGLSALTSAQATIVVGVWDPAYDPINFPNLGWRGKIVVDVPPACLAQPTGIYTTISGPCSFSPVLEAKVELYNINTPGEPTLQVLDFTPVYIYGADSVAIASPGVIAGFDLPLSGQIASTIAEAEIGLEQAIFTLDLNFNSFMTGQEITLSWFTPLGQGGTAADVNKIAPKNITFTVVPEPAGMLLAGSALLALGWTRRRRQG